MVFGLIEEVAPVDRVFEIRNFTLTRYILFGVGTVERAGVEAKRLGARRVGIVTDKGIEKAGLLDKVGKILEREKLDFEANTELGTGEPFVSTVNSIGEWARKGGFDFVIGLGGGTACDTSKNVSYLATNPGDITDHLGGDGFRISLGGEVKPWQQKPLPLMTIATTAGTGAEISHSGGAILPGVGKGWSSTPESPQAAIVDPAMTVTCPPIQTAATGMDGIGHMIQYVLTRTPLPLADALALRGIKLYADNLRTATYNGADIRARWNLSLASMLWGFMGCWGTGGSMKNEGMGNFIGAKYNIPHGHIVGLELPYCMEFSLPASVNRLALIAAEGFGEDLRGLSMREAAFRAVQDVARLVKDLGLRTCLKEWNIPKEDLPELVDYFLTKLVRYTDRRPFTRENVTELFNRMWEGRIGD